MREKEMALKMQKNGCFWKPTNILICISSKLKALINFIESCFYGFCYYSLTYLPFCATSIQLKAFVCEFVGTFEFVCLAWQEC